MAFTLSNDRNHLHLSVRVIRVESGHFVALVDIRTRMARISSSTPEGPDPEFVVRAAMELILEHDRIMNANQVTIAKLWVRQVLREISSH